MTPSTATPARNTPTRERAGAGGEDSLEIAATVEFPAGRMEDPLDVTAAGIGSRS